MADASKRVAYSIEDETIIIIKSNICVYRKCHVKLAVVKSSNANPKIGF